MSVTAFAPASGASASGRGVVWRRGVAAVVVLAALPLLGACTDTRVRSRKLQSFRVSLQEGSTTGTAQNPIGYTRNPISYRLNIEALDSAGERVTDYDGTVAVSVAPGELTGTMPGVVKLTGGLLEGLVVSLRRAFGAAHIVVQDKSGTNLQAVGASPTLYFQYPRIRDIQEPAGSRDNSPVVGTEVIIDRGRNMVVHVSNAGFFVVDREETEYGSLFAFNFSRPEAVRRGDKLKTLSGQVLEFLGYTELSFPIWEVDFRCPTAEDPGQVCDSGQFCIEGRCYGQECGDRLCPEGSVCGDGNRCVPNRNVPDARDVTSIVTNTREMEKFESNLGRVNNVINSQQFKNCDDKRDNPGANENGVCEFCRTCSANRDVNGICPGGGRCCPVGQLCNVGAGECTSACNADVDERGACPVGKRCCAEGPCNMAQGVCGGCTTAEKTEGACENECASRTRNSPGGVCTSTCDFIQFGQYRVGLAGEDGTWTGQSILVTSKDTIPRFRPDAQENLGKALPSIQGILRNIFAPTSMWVVEPRDECDFEGIERTRTDCADVK